MIQKIFCSQSPARFISLTLITIAAMTFANRVAAKCPDFGTAGAHYPTAIGQVIGSQCTTQDGRQGRQECHPDQNIQGLVCTPKERIQADGSAYPKFLIGTVVYAPPGSASCGARSTVSYGDGTSVGTTVSSSSSYKRDLKISAEAKGGVFGAAEVGVNFGTTRSSGSGDAMNVVKSELSTISVTASCTDGIDHAQDQIWLLLGPEVQMTTFDPAGCTTCSEEVKWSLGARGELVWVRVGELVGLEPMRVQIADAFARHGVTDEDLWTILNANPYWWTLIFGDPVGEPDPSRYVRVPGTFPYEPTLGGSNGMRMYQMMNEALVISSSESSYEYTVGASLAGGFKFFEIANVMLKSSASWTWTSKNSSSDMNSTSTAAFVAIHPPSDAYTGPISIAAYYDTIYKSYLFVPVM